MKDKQTPQAPVSAPAPAMPRYRSEDQFAGGRVVVIGHADREYLLRVTTVNKLILTA